MRFLVTAGPTREPLDPVRYLSNRSSGKMGYAIARAAQAAGHQTILISGPVALQPPEGVEVRRVLTAEEMYDAVHQRVGSVDVCILCAAVSDWRPREIAPHKLKKQGRETLTLELVPTRDILASLRGWAGEGRKRALITVGFAAETEHLLENARRKLREKGCALIAANDVSQDNIGFESDENELLLVFASGETRVLIRASKEALATQLVKIIEEL